MVTKKRIPRLVHEKQCMICGLDFKAHKSNAKCCSDQCRTALKYARNAPERTFIGEHTGFVNEKGNDCFYRGDVEKMADAAGCPWTRVYGKVDRRDGNNNPIFKFYCLVA